MSGRIIVVPLGPGDPTLLTLQAADLLRCGMPLFLRTERHPVASWLKAQGVAFSSFDDLYESADDFHQLYTRIADTLVESARSDKILYAVSDPFSDESLPVLSSVAQEHAIPYQVLPGVSLASSCLTACQQNYQGIPMTISPAASFSAHLFDPSRPTLLTELDSQLLAGEVKLRLLSLIDGETQVCFLPPSETAERSYQMIPLFELDRQKRYDQTTALFIPASGFLFRNRYSFEDLQQIVSRLRSQNGCPWDRAQTHVSLRPYMVEEAWEAVSAIDEGDPDHLADELGDVLFQVMIHTDIAESYDEFTMTDVLSHICRKMIQRHPHVFGSMKADSAEDVAAGWETVKRQETGSRTVGESLEDVSPALPSLKYGIKVHKKLAQLPALRRSREDLASEIDDMARSLRSESNNQEQRMGALLLKCAQWCFAAETDAEILLHEAVDQLKKNYEFAEKTIFQEGKRPEDLSYCELREYLNRADKRIRPSHRQ